MSTTREIRRPDGTVITITDTPIPDIAVNTAVALSDLMTAIDLANRAFELTFEAWVNTPADAGTLRAKGHADQRLLGEQFVLVSQRASKLDQIVRLLLTQ